MAEQKINPYMDETLLECQKNFNPQKNKKFESRFNVETNYVKMPWRYRPSCSSGVYGAYSHNSFPEISVKPTIEGYDSQNTIYLQRNETKELQIKSPYQFNVKYFGIDVAGHGLSFKIPVKKTQKRNMLNGTASISWHQVRRGTVRSQYRLGYYRTSLSVCAIGLVREQDMTTHVSDKHDRDMAYNMSWSFREARDVSLKKSYPLEVQESVETMRERQRWQKEEMEREQEREKEEKIQGQLREKEKKRREKIESSYVDPPIQTRINNINNSLIETNNILEDAIRELREMMDEKESDEQKSQ
eukprot:363422_1